jgi:GDPmannose 4,6-dehydratase
MINQKENKIALVCGVSGQDGAYLAKLLLQKEYEVWGSSRDAQSSSFGNLTKLGIKAHVKYLSMIPEDYSSVFMAIKKSNANEVYYLAGQSSVELSFEQPAETIKSISIGTLNILEACRMADREIKLYHAGSSECFGDTNGLAANESTVFHPRSPYAVAKTSAYWLVDNYREAYNLWACTGILFNHESPLRTNRFVTQKIITSAKRIKNGSNETLFLGNLQISRDWGWAPEYVEAMWLMLQQKIPMDYVIATGESNKLENFVDFTFSKLGLDYRKYVKQDLSFIRPSDLEIVKANPEKAKINLNWEAKFKMKDVINFMLEHD